MYDKREVINALRSVGSNGKPTAVRSSTEFYEIIGDDETVDRLFVHLRNCKTVEPFKENDEMIILYEKGTDKVVAGILMYTSHLNKYVCYRIIWL